MWLHFIHKYPTFRVLLNAETINCTNIEIKFTRCCFVLLET
jgi:hypothetical protein